MAVTCSTRSARSSRFSVRRESIAEVPETLAAACELFSASGYVQEALLTDYVLPSESRAG